MTDLTTHTMSSVLVVDDDESIRLLLRKWMDAEGYRVSIAENGLSAVEKATAKPPDVILLDAQMPVRWARCSAALPVPGLR